MTEIQKKYQIGVRRFGLINWIGAYNLYVKEVNRFFIVWSQTLLSPLISSLLFSERVLYTFMSLKFSIESPHSNPF